MITFLKGILIEKNPSYVVLDVNDVGYFIKISFHTSLELPKEGKVHLYIHPIIREDQHSLYGFSSVKEREVFAHLLSVGGVGPSSAMVLLSSLKTEEIIQAIYENKIDVFKKVKGIGEKTAQRIVIELKGKPALKEEAISVSGMGTRKIRTEALEALSTLGFSQKEIEKRLDKILNTQPLISLEELVKEILRNF